MIRILRKDFSKNNFALSDEDDHASRQLSRRGIRFIFAENTINNLPKVARTKLLGSN